MSDRDFHIKENSLIARLAAKKLRKKNISILIGRTIHLYGTTKENFLSNETWLKHELRHVQQYREHGFIPFIAKYLWESMRKGYYDNKYEAEAREAEK